MKCLFERQSEVLIPIRFITVHTAFKAGSGAVLNTLAKAGLTGFGPALTRLKVECHAIRRQTQK